MTDNSNDEPKKLGTVYNLNEAAKRLHMSRRSLQDMIIRLPFYSKNGMVYLFSEDDISKIWEGMREESNERLRLLERSAPAGRLMGAKSPRLQQLLSKPARPKPSSKIRKQLAEILQKRDER